MVAGLSPAELGKFISAKQSLSYVKDGMKLGLGTGSTAAWVVKLLAHEAKLGLSFRATATSNQTTQLAQSLGLTIEPLDELGQLDLAIDGADEFDPALNLIKGGGGALLQEKIVERAADQLVIITDASKEVDALGAFPLPIEIIKFGWQTTMRQVIELIADHGYGQKRVERRGGDHPFVTDEKHFIFDLHLEKITNPATLHSALLDLPGVVETGLFMNMADAIVMGDATGLAKTKTQGSDWTSTQHDLDQDASLILELIK